MLWRKYNLLLISIRKQAKYGKINFPFLKYWIGNNNLMLYYFRTIDFSKKRLVYSYNFENTRKKISSRGFIENLRDSLSYSRLIDFFPIHRPLTYIFEALWIKVDMVPIHELQWESYGLFPKYFKDHADLSKNKLNNGLILDKTTKIEILERVL